MCNIGLGKVRVSFSLFFCCFVFFVCTIFFLFCFFIKRLWKLKQQIVRYNSQKSKSLQCCNLIIISFQSFFFFICCCRFFSLSVHLYFICLFTFYSYHHSYYFDFRFVLFLFLFTRSFAVFFSWACVSFYPTVMCAFCTVCMHFLFVIYKTLFADLYFVANVCLSNNLDYNNNSDVKNHASIRFRVFSVCCFFVWILFSLDESSKRASENS